MVRNRWRRWGRWLLLLLFTVSANYLILQNNYFWTLRGTESIQLSAAQKKSLAALPPVHLEIYARRNPQLRRAMDNLLRPLLVYVPSLTVSYVNPDLDPVKAQRRDITAEGQLYLETARGGQKIALASAPALVRALLAEASASDRFIVHLQGHGERDYLSDSAGSWRSFYRRLQAGDISHGVFDLKDGPLPQSAEALVIADPDPIPAADQQVLAAAIDKGLNLLYSTDVQKHYLPEFLQQISGLAIVDGKIVSAASLARGLENPQFLVVEDLGDTPITRPMTKSPLLPEAVGFRETGPSGWRRQVLLWSDAKSWAERGDMAKPPVKFDADEDVRGPIALGWLLTRPHPSRAGQTQSIVILGDSDLAQENYLASGGNSQLLDNIVGQLRSVAVNRIVATERPDQFINLANEHQMALAVLLLTLPLVLLVGGLLWSHWRYR